MVYNYNYLLFLIKKGNQDSLVILVYKYVYLYLKIPYFFRYNVLAASGSYGD